MLEGEVYDYDEMKRLFLAQPDEVRWNFCNSFREYLIQTRGLVFRDVMMPSEYSAEYLKEELDDGISIEQFDREVADVYGLWNYSIDDIDELVGRDTEYILVDFGREGQRLVEVPEQEA